MKTFVDYRKYRELLSHEFNNKCAYCESPLGITDLGCIEHFYPRSKYPDKEFNLENMLLVCTFCDRYKSDSFPLDSEGNPLLLNPRTDDFNTHIILNSNGTVSALTDRGKCTIEVLNLNRIQLVESRRFRQIEKEYFANFTATPPNTYKVFNESIDKIQKLNDCTISEEIKLQGYLNNMLYANVITSLETYLCDFFVETTISNKNNFIKFVETFEKFRKDNS